MTKLEWIFSILLVVGAVLTFIWLLLLFFQSRKTSDIKYLERKKKKRKSSSKTTKKAIDKLKMSRKKQWKWIGLTFLAALSCFSGSAYVKYYELTTLSEEDTYAIVQSYYLLNEMETQLTKVSNEGFVSEKVQNNIDAVSVRLASYTVKQGSDRNNIEGQTLLNKYYASMGQLGVNISAQKELNQEKTTELIADIKNSKKSQKKVLLYFEINEQSLKQKQ